MMMWWSLCIHVSVEVEGGMECVNDGMTQGAGDGNYPSINQSLIV